MAYTAPKTWTVFEKPTSAQFNTYMRDNMTYVHDIHHATYIGITPAGSTASTTFVNVGAGGSVTKRQVASFFVVCLKMCGYLSAGIGRLTGGVNANGVDVSGGDLFKNETADRFSWQTWVAIGTGLNWAATSYTFNVRVKTQGGGVTFAYDAADQQTMVVFEAVLG